MLKPGGNINDFFRKSKSTACLAGFFTPTPPNLTFSWWSGTPSNTIWHCTPQVFPPNDILNHQISDDSINRKYRYIVFDIDVGLSYRIVEKNIKFVDTLRYLLCITIFSMYCDILRQKFIFLLLHYQNSENKWRKWQTNRSKLTIVS